MNPSLSWSDLNPAAIQQLVDGLVVKNPELITDIKVLRSIFSFIDLTTLESTDNEEKIIQLCQKAIAFAEKGLHFPAAVCVYPPFVRSVKKYLAGTGINVAAATGYFPSGQSPLFLKIEEVKYALDEGADEVDFVISRGKFLEGDHNYIHDEIASIKRLTETLPLKVIIETGDLKTFDNIKKASEIAIGAGADFIKTSTGKILPAATEEAAFIMIHTIHDHYLATGKRIGFKPSGGITGTLQALRYFLMVRLILGEEWLSKDLFRIGASRLADQLIIELSA
jgi:deoxyribose-phosphate aldolase